MYEYLDYLKGLTSIPIIVHRERHIINDLLDVLDGFKTRYANPPFFVKRADGKQAKLMRQCTKEYKIEMVERAIRRTYLGLKPRQRIPKDIQVNMMIGISTDEIERVKPSQTPWIQRSYPLIEEMEMSRGDCTAWMVKQGYKAPPRSSCMICPFHSDSEWARLMSNPKYREHIIMVDSAIRKGLKGTHEGTQLYLHRSLRPIDEIQFDDNEESTFAEECEGICGL
ncbi:hypothetical protein D3C74_327540 [compost metagenome]